MKKVSKSLLSAGIASSMVLSSTASFASGAKVNRPPQFILFAYDGSYNNEVWSGSREFTRLHKQEGVDVRFTYFINPVYLIHETNNRQVVTAPWAQNNGGQIVVNNVRKNVYLPPHKNDVATTSYTGRVSDIGVGDNQKDVETRIEEMTDAHLEGHEIASHAVGHFDGSKWTETQWTNEFLQFKFILDNVFSLNQIKPSNRNANGLIFKDQITGFRAPVLGFNNDLFKVLKKFNFRYDTSQQDTMNYWPQKNKNGHWNFPLAALPKPGTGKTVPSMDYNFCVQDSARLAAQDPSIRKIKVYSEKKKAYITPNSGECFNVVSPEQKAEIKANMLNIYRSYFKNNYYGNRAPIHIGHHFSSWMSGAYYEAFFEFADEVCKKPEVKCVTYRELTAFMDQQSSDQIASYRKGEFEKVIPQKQWNDRAMMLSRSVLDLKAKLIQKGDTVAPQFTGLDKEKVARIQMNINGVNFDVSKVELSKIKELLDSETKNQLMMIARDKYGKEIQSATYFIEQGNDGALKISDKSLEERSEAGHMIEAHEDELFDSTNGH